MSNIIDLDMNTTLPVHPDKVLKNTIGILQEVVLVGYNNEGEIYCASSTSDTGTLILLLERAKELILKVSK
jgi:hypothetical protein